MTVHAIKVPDLGEGVAEVELVAWRVNPRYGPGRYGPQRAGC